MVACSDQPRRKMILASVCEVLQNREMGEAGQPAKQVIGSQA